MIDLKGRTAVITGGGGGIGRALALKAGSRGMSVCIADVDAAKLAETEALLRAREVPVYARQLDVRSTDEQERFAEACFDRFASIAMMWANAGVIRWDNSLDMNTDDWMFVLDVNLKGVVNSVAAFARRMHERGEPARFVITGSQASFMTVPLLGPYAASKHACWAIAETLAQELAQAGSAVTASLLAPPRVDTGLIALSKERARQQGGEAGVAALLASTITPEQLVDHAFEKAVAGDFFILPGYADIAEIVKARLAPLL